MPQVPKYPSQPARYPSPRSGLTQPGAVAARAPTKRTDTHNGSGNGDAPVRLKSAAEEFRQSIRIDIGGLEMRAQEGKGSRFEAARNFCELQHSLVALTTKSVSDKLAALADINAAVTALDAQFPGVFADAKDLALSAREAIFISESIEHLGRDFGTADLEHATFLLNRSDGLVWQIAGGPAPFKERLSGELYHCLLGVKITHSDPHVCELLGVHLMDMDLPPPRSEGAASSSFSFSQSAGPSPSDVASLRAAESTRVTLPPLNVHVEPATEQAAATFLNPAKGVQGLGRTTELVENVAKLSISIDKFVEELLPLQASHLSGRLLMAEVAMLIDQILLHGGPGEVALFARLGAGLNELRVTHKDPEMRAEMSRVLKYCFDHPGGTGPIRAHTGEDRLRERVEFLLADGPKMAPDAKKCLKDFAFKLVDDIKRDIGEDSLLMLHLLDELEGLPGLDGLAAEIYERSWS